MNAKEELSVALLGAVCLLGLILYAVWPHVFKAPPQPRVAASAFCSNLLPRVILDGKAAYAEELKTNRVLYEKNADAQIPLASLTKLMTVLVASETLKKNDTVTISEEALSPEGDAGLAVGEEWDMQTLTDFTLLTSANDGAHALALAAEKKLSITPQDFVQKMNAKALSIGLVQTFFMDDTGLDISEENAGAYGSAKDVAKLFTYIARTNPRLIEGTSAGAATFTSKSGIVHSGENTSTVVTELPGALGAKTGFTDLAGGNLALIYEPLPGRPVALVILGSTREGRDADMKILAAAAQTTLRRAILCEMSGVQ
jgi:D-alanyl-D-alanine carboxypeptidase